MLEQLGDIETLNIMQIQVLPVTANNIAKATMVDPVLSRVYQYVMNGWPNEVSEDLKPFKQGRLELTVEENCILWGIRVIVARNHFWWPKIDSNIVEVVQSCGPCQSVHEKP